MKMTILVGLPGSGKSTWAKQIEDFATIVNQDTLGNRDACTSACIDALSKGLDVIIDRTNINRYQRSHWIKIAKHFNVTQIEAVYFDASPEQCLKRALKRKNHPTIPSNTPPDKIRSIINKFNKTFQKVEVNEGFSSIFVIPVDSASQRDQSFCSGYWDKFITFINKFSFRY